MSSQSSRSAGEVTRILEDIRGGRISADGLLPIVYAELRRLAEQRLARESPGQTLQATALVHEAYLRLVPLPDDAGWQSRGHFFAAAAEAMRRILVENARRKRRVKHGGQRRRVELQDAHVAIVGPAEDILALDAALDEFGRLEPDKARLVKLRYFAGLTEQEAADALGISRSTAARHWAFARAWLFDRIQSGSPD